MKVRSLLVQDQTMLLFLSSNFSFGHDYSYINKTAFAVVHSRGGNGGRLVIRNGCSGSDIYRGQYVSPPPSTGSGQRLYGGLEDKDNVPFPRLSLLLGYISCHSG